MSRGRDGAILNDRKMDGFYKRIDNWCVEESQVQVQVQVHTTCIGMSRQHLPPHPAPVVSLIAVQDYLYTSMFAQVRYRRPRSTVRCKPKLPSKVARQAAVGRRRRKLRVESGLLPGVAEGGGPPVTHEPHYRLGTSRYLP